MKSAPLIAETPAHHDEGFRTPSDVSFYSPFTFIRGVATKTAHPTKGEMTPLIPELQDFNGGYSQIREGTLRASDLSYVSLPDQPHPCNREAFHTSG
jgi:hypothetical protein